MTMATSMPAICRRRDANGSSPKNKLLVASLLLVVRPGAPSSVLAPGSDALCS